MIAVDPPQVRSTNVPFIKVARNHCDVYDPKCPLNTFVVVGTAVNELRRRERLPDLLNIGGRELQRAQNALDVGSRLNHCHHWSPGPKNFCRCRRD